MICEIAANTTLLIGNATIEVPADLKGKCVGVVGGLQPYGGLCRFQRVQARAATACDVSPAGRAVRASVAASAAPVR